MCNPNSERSDGGSAGDLERGQAAFGRPRGEWRPPRGADRSAPRPPQTRLRATGGPRDRGVTGPACRPRSWWRPAPAAHRTAPRRPPRPACRSGGSPAGSGGTPHRSPRARLARLSVTSQPVLHCIRPISLMADVEAGIVDPDRPAAAERSVHLALPQPRQSRPVTGSAAPGRRPPVHRRAGDVAHQLPDIVLARPLDTHAPPRTLHLSDAAPRVPSRHRDLGPMSSCAWSAI